MTMHHPPDRRVPHGGGCVIAVGTTLILLTLVLITIHVIIWTVR